MNKIASLAKEALDIQDACNLLGLSKRFPLAIQELSDELRATGEHHGTDLINRHPITQLWVSKLESLSGHPRLEAWGQVEVLAGTMQEGESR